jgi:hypothetical protein
MKTHILLLSLILLPFLAKSQTVSYNFEDGDLSAWTQSAEGLWEVSTSNAIEGAQSLKHAPASGEGIDRVSVDLPIWSGNEGIISWRFKLRHGWNPSSGNHWGVFLSSDKDATGMVSSESPNGYLIGVNLTGSDDMLRLYRVENGSFSSIHATSINWQTQITTSGVGAIEIERDVNGTFTLRVSTSGSYQDLQDQGSVTDATFTIGGYLGVYYSYTTSAAGLLTIDDVQLAYQPLNTNDYDAEVTEPSTQIAGGIISSLATSNSDAVDVFRFTVTDQATSDGLPTDVTKLKFSKVAGANAASLPETIGGVTLSGSEGSIAIDNVQVTDDFIEVNISQGQMVIDDGSSDEFTLSVYLNPESIVDGATLQLMVNSENHGWESFFEGSAFAVDFPADVVSNLFTIQVLPTHLSFFTYPQQLSLNQPFSIVAHASDISGNLATTYNDGSVSLALASGQGELLPAESLVSNAINGVITWADITYNGNDNFSLAASAAGLEDAIGDEIVVVNDPTTEVTVPAEQPTGESISSLLTLPGEAKEVFRFRIADDGQNDGQPTYVQQIYIKRPTGSNIASFSGNLAGVVVRVNNQVVSIGNPHILTASISIPVPFGVITVPDGQTAEVSVSVYLKSGGLADGANLGFMVDQNDHNFLAYSQGSTFASDFPVQVLSNTFPIDVEATTLKFTSAPSQVGLGDEFSVEVSTVDDGGSIDIDAAGTIILSKNSGAGDVSIPTPEATISSGKATWSGLSYNAAEPFTLLASSPNYNDAISSLIYCSDNTSTLALTATPLTDGQISTLAITPADAVEIFRFAFSDLGTTDGLPTYVTRMVFKPFGLPTDKPLNGMLGGVSVWSDDQQIPLSSVTIAAQSITIDFEVGDVSIPDGETLELNLKGYLKEGGQTDGSTLCLHVPASGHGWQTSYLGSGLSSTFSVGIVGPVFTVDAQATSLAFVQQPFLVSHPQPITLAVAAVDEFGSIDSDATGNVTLGLSYGSAGYHTSSSVLSFISGVAVWSDVELEAQGKYQFLAEANVGGQVTAFSDPIWNGGQTSCPVDEDFEDGYPATFPNTEHWAVSTVSPVYGGGSLKHNLSGVTGVSNLAIDMTVNNLGDSPKEWVFTMRNGNWDPSADNAFWFVLASDSETIELGQFNGYAVGVNLSGADDLLTLWRISKDAGASIMVQSPLDWDESETIPIRVTRSPNGEWSLWYKTETSESYYQLAGRAIDLSVSSSVTCGPVFSYTTSRAGELWIDNLSICGVQYPPVIQSARLLNLSSVSIIFSSAVNIDDATSPANYSIKDGSGQGYSVIAVYENIDNPQQFSLRTEQLPTENLMLFAHDISSLNGEMVVNDSISIGMGAMGNFGNLVINEIMARPSTATELPSVEYVELYNRTSSPISLAGWKVKGNDNIATIPEGVIEPNGYLILSGTSGQEAMSQFGNAIGVPSFPTLLVGGMFLGIYDSAGSLISWVEYSDTWYNDDIKDDGGYSLERIDSDNLVQGAANWTATNDASGGTPGRANSVSESNPDVESPQIVELGVTDNLHITVGFSEVMDSLSVTMPQAYSLSNGIGNPVWLATTDYKYNRVELTLGTPMVVGEEYDLCFTSEITDFSGNPLSPTCLQVAIPQTPNTGDVIINEVLFNPYSGGVDFVELYNRSDKAVDLKSMWIANRNKTTLELNEYFLASGSSWLLMPNAYAVLTDNPSLVSQFYYVENPSAMVDLSKLPAYPNDNGYVVLINEVSEVIDELRYDEGMHNTLLSDVKGISLERLNPDLPTNEASSWQSAAQTAGFATPTAKNSQFTSAIKGDDSFNLSHQVFSPDGDGFEDVLLINYELPESGYIANIMVFDSRGRRVKRLASNMLLGTSGSIQWDGADDAGRRAKMGAYVIFIEAFDLKGNVNRYKKTVVVATKLR